MPHHIIPFLFGSLLTLAALANPGEPLDTSGPRFGLPHDIELRGDIAWVAAHSGGLLVFNVADPTTPALIGRVRTESGARHIAVRGDLMAVLGTTQLHLLDISQPETPLLINSVEGFEHVREMKIQDHLIAVGEHHEGAGTRLRVVDISDPQQPALATSQFIDRGLGDIEFVEQSVWIASGSTLCSVFDVADPSQPTLLTSAAGGHFGQIEHRDGVLFAVSGSDFRSFSVSGTMTTLLDSIPVGPNSTLTGLRLEGERAYRTDFAGSIEAFDVSDPANLSVARRDRVWGSVADVASSGPLLFVTCPYLGLMVLDQSLVPEGAHSTISTYDTRGSARGLDRVRNVLFVADGSAGLTIVDASDPWKLAEIGRLGTPGLCTHVVVVGHIAYLADENALLLADVSDPTAPVLLGAVDSVINAYRLAHYGDHLYVAAGAQGGVVVLNVADPAAPTSVGQFDTPGDALDVATDGERLAVADGANGVIVYDLVDPAQPTLIGTNSTPAPATGVDVRGEYLAIAAGHLRFVHFPNQVNADLLDILFSASGTRAARFHGPRLYGAADQSGVIIGGVDDDEAWTIENYDTSGRAYDVLPGNGVTYVADGNPGVIVLSDAPDGRPYSVIGEWRPPIRTRAMTLSEDGSTLAIGDVFNGVHLIDVSEPLDPVLLGRMPTMGEVRSLAFYRDRLFAVARSTGLNIIDVTRPFAPDRLALHSPYLGAVRILRDHGIAYLAERNGVVIVDLADEDFPRRIGRVEGIGLTPHVHDDRLLVTHTGGFRLFDISDPRTPVWLSDFSISLPPEARVAVQGDIVYLAGRRGEGLHFIDISDPGAPVLLATHPVPEISDLAISGRLAYLAIMDGVVRDVRIVNVSDFSTPQEVFRIPMDDGPEALLLRDGFLHVGTDSSGLEVLDVRDCTPCRGDVTGDGVIDASDVAHVLDYWGRHVHPDTLADANGDGMVDFADLTLVLALWGGPCGG